MDDMEYVRDLAKIAYAYSSGEITSEEFHKQMAELRDRRIGSWEQESKPQPPA